MQMHDRGAWEWTLAVIAGGFVLALALFWLLGGGLL